MITENSKSNRNCSIDIFRLLFAIYVVAIHSRSQLLSAVPFLDLVVSSLFRFAVPFFLTVSGYYFYKNPEKLASRKGLLGYVKNIVVIYIFWSIPYFAIRFLSENYTSITKFIVDCIYSFFIEGSYYHLWYFPALIFCVTFSAILWRCRLKKLLICVSVLLYPLFLIFTNLSIFTFSPQILEIFTDIRPFLQGLFFFGSGLFVKIGYDTLSANTRHRYLRYILPVSVTAWLGLVWLNDFFSLGLVLTIYFGIYINVALIVLTLLFNPLPQHSALAKKCRYLANYTYYAHMIFRSFLNLVHSHFFPFPEFLFFPITVFLTIVSGLILYKINSKTINRFIC